MRLAYPWKYQNHQSRQDARGQIGIETDVLNRFRLWQVRLDEVLSLEGECRLMRIRLQVALEVMPINIGKISLVYQNFLQGDSRTSMVSCQTPLARFG